MDDLISQGKKQNPSLTIQGASNTTSNFYSSTLGPIASQDQSKAYN